MFDSQIVGSPCMCARAFSRAGPWHVMLCARISIDGKHSQFVWVSEPRPINVQFLVRSRNLIMALSYCKWFFMQQLKLVQALQKNMQFSNGLYICMCLVNNHSPKSVIYRLSFVLNHFGKIQGVKYVQNAYQQKHLLFMSSRQNLSRELN